MHGFSGLDARVADHIVGARKPTTSITPTVRNVISSMGSISRERLPNSKRKKSTLTSCQAGLGWRLRHIKKPVTLPPEKAERLYVAAEAVQELAELTEECDDKVPVNLLRILGKELTDVITDESFPFEGEA